MFKTYEHMPTLLRDLKRSAGLCVTCLGMGAFLWLAVGSLDHTVPASLCATSGTVFTTFTADLHC